MIKIEVEVEPRLLENKEKPYKWIISLIFKGYNEVFSGWAKTPKEAFEEAYKQFNQYEEEKYKPKEILEKDYGVHIGHCCVLHGCKYGEENCPVVLKKVKQEYPCESCDHDDIKTVDEAQFIRKQEDESVKCLTCKGRGKVYINDNHGANAGYFDCDDCNGTGRIKKKVDVK